MWKVGGEMGCRVVVVRDIGTGLVIATVCEAGLISNSDNVMLLYKMLL